MRMIDVGSFHSYLVGDLTLEAQNSHDLKINANSQLAPRIKHK